VISPGILLAAAGDERFASALSASGVDRVIAYHSSVYRGLGLPSVAGLLPWASANSQTLGVLPGVIAGAGSTPVIATVCANDGLLPRAQMLERVRAAGSAGVLNAPTVGFYEGTMRSVLEAEGLGRDTEIQLIRDAIAVGLEAWAYVFDPEWARRAAEAGATGVIVHLGITGYPSLTDGEACVAAAKAAGAEQILLHGGSLRDPQAFRAELERYDPIASNAVTGYMGASVFERTDDLTATVQGWRTATTRLESGATR